MSDTPVTEIRLSYPAQAMLRRMHEGENYQIVLLAERLRMPPSLLTHGMVKHTSWRTYELTGRGLAWLATHPKEQTA